MRYSQRSLELLMIAISQLEDERELKIVVAADDVLLGHVVDQIPASLHYRKRSDRAAVMGVDWGKVMIGRDVIQLVLRQHFPEASDEKINGMTHAIENIARDHYARGMLQVQQGIIRELDLRHLLGIR